MLKIVLTGPESTGKTTLALALTQHFPNALLASEYARIYINELTRPYRQEDLLTIAQKQLEFEERQRSKNPDFLFCDTAFIVLKIWSMYKYGTCHPFIEQLARTRQYDLFLLCGTDVPWEADPQRENPQEREELYTLYRQELQKNKHHFIELTGNKNQRLATALQIVSTIA